MKKALITGITGQDGAYLAEFLLEKGYEVHGIKRRSSLFNTQRIDHLFQDPHEDNVKLFLHYGDLTDSMNLTRIINQVKPDEIYNLGAMSPRIGSALIRLNTQPMLTRLGVLANSWRPVRTPWTGENNPFLPSLNLGAIR